MELLQQVAGLGAAQADVAAGGGVFDQVKRLWVLGAPVGEDLQMVHKHPVTPSQQPPQDVEDLLDAALQLRLGDEEGREEADASVEGFIVVHIHQNTPFFEQFHHLEHLQAVKPLGEIHRRHQPQATDAGASRQPLPQPGQQQFALLLHVELVIVFHAVQHPHGRRHGSAVAALGGEVFQAGTLLREQVGAGLGEDQDPQGQVAVVDGLGQADQVRGDLRLLPGEGGAGAAKAGGHLVRHQQHIPFPAALLNVLEDWGGDGHHPAGGHHRLHDEAGQVVPFPLPQAVDGLTPGVLVGVVCRDGDPADLRHQGAVDVGQDLVDAADAHGAVGGAVVGQGEGGDASALRAVPEALVLAAGLDGRLHRL